MIYRHNEMALIKAYDEQTFLSEYCMLQQEGFTPTGNMSVHTKPESYGPMTDLYQLFCRVQ